MIYLGLLNRIQSKDINRNSSNFVKYKKEDKEGELLLCTRQM